MTFHTQKPKYESNLSVHWQLDKEHVVHIYIHTMKYYSAKKKKEEEEEEWSLTICTNMDGSRGYYAKWNKSDSKRKILYDFTYTWNLKIKTKKWTIKTNKLRYREQADGCQMEGGWGAG